jgi:putative membrane protein
VSVRARDAIGPGERLRVESALLEQLAESEAELCVLVVGACDDYAFAGWRLGVLLAALAASGLAAASADVPAAALLAAQGAALLAGHGLARLGAVRRLLFSESLADRRAVARAERGFAEAGLDAAGGAGILLFVALLERRVLVLAGERVARIARQDGASAFAGIAGSLAASLRRGRAADGLLEAVESLGKLACSRLPGPARPAAARLAAAVVED